LSRIAKRGIAASCRTSKSFLSNTKASLSSPFQGTKLLTTSAASNQENTNRRVVSRLALASAAVVTFVGTTTTSRGRGKSNEERTLNSSSTRVRCETMATTTTIPLFETTSTSKFQLKTTSKKLIQEDPQRIVMAHLLHDFHEVALQQKNQVPWNTDAIEITPRKGSIRRLWRRALKPLRTREAVQSLQPVTTSHVNFDTLTFEQATDLMEKILHHQFRLDPSCLVSLLNTATNVFTNEATLLDLTNIQAERICVVGDLHGSLASLSYVIQSLEGELGKTTAVVFDGDFVDRGSQGLEVMCILFLLKLMYPQHVYLLRGNHEDSLIASSYGFEDELVSKYGEDEYEVLWDAFMASFRALPIAAVTNNSFIVHGGLPSQSFQLDDLRAVTAQDRCQVNTTIQPRNKVEKLLQGLLWSDPTVQDGIYPNKCRTVGTLFGPDVASEFLKRHGLKYLIRAHEVAENGTAILDCGEGRAVITVFSHPDYPNGEGENFGGYIHLNNNGTYKLVQFSPNTPFLPSEYNKLNLKDPYVQTLKSLISSNRQTLEAKFNSIAPDSYINTFKWAEVMGICLSDLPWLSLLPSLVPFSNEIQEYIDWRNFLDLHASAAEEQSPMKSNVRVQILQANKKMAEEVFKLLDTDGNGYVDLNEFTNGYNLMNSRLQNKRKTMDSPPSPATIFANMDPKGKGRITLEEFCDWFRVL
jgi:serine/threonine-protein phosphatase PP1 catalytic subunit